MSDANATVKSHAARLRGARILDLLEAEDRMGRFCAALGPMWVDFSKQLLDPDALDALVAWATSRQVSEAIAAMFAGEKVNVTEGRPALHVALRASGRTIEVEGEDVVAQAGAVRARMHRFAEGVRRGEILSDTDEAFTDVVHVGIGGSELGPAMICAALSEFADGPRVHFVANVDGAATMRVLDGLNPATTLVTVASKTFTTQETLTNAATIRDWIEDELGEDAIAKHFVALSTNAEAANAFGIPAERCFASWPWVGGRFSTWGCVGLPIALYLGPRHFDELLAGAQAVDEHFERTPLEANVPVLLALLEHWNAEVFSARAAAVVPYDEGLARLPDYLQQLVMESNGKSVTRQGTPVAGASAPVVFGGAGTTGQHAYFQMLHQGPRCIPVDFIVVAGSQRETGDHHDKLVANALAQAAALVRGRSADEARAGLAEGGSSESEVERLVPHMVCPGNRPSTTLLLPELRPDTLGALLSLYEHRVFVSGVLANVESFDQWGVELGKEVARSVLPALYGENESVTHDPSTRSLIERIRALRGGGDESSS